MALSLQGTSRLGVPTAAPTKTVVPQPMAAQPPSAVANPTPYTPPTDNYPTKGYVTGPWDRFRDKPPEGVPVSFWNDQIDSHNKLYANASSSDKKQLTEGLDGALASVQKNATRAYAALPAGQRAAYEQRDMVAAPNGYGDPNSPANVQSGFLGTAGQYAADDFNAQNDFFNTNVAPGYAALPGAQVAAGAADKDALAALKAAGVKADKTNADAFAEQRGLANTYNTQGTNAFNAHKAGQDALNAEDEAGLAAYLKGVDPLRAQIKGIGSNPEDVAAQQAALQRAIAIAGGSLDYQSQAAQAFANPEDLANQRKALADIQADVGGGDKDQRDALNLIKSRTGVEPTAQERLLYELNRRTRESTDASSRAAVMEQQKARGLRSGGAELASMRQAGQQTAQDRLLADMAANAGAVQRAQSYTGMQAAQSNAMRTNAQTGLGMQAGLSTAMRNAGFDEAWKRGQGADTASENNQRTKLGGAELQVNSSNAIRTAGDTMNMHLDEQAQQDATRRAELEGSIATEGRASTNQRGTRADTTYKEGVVSNDTNYGRGRQVISDVLGSIDPTFERDKGVAGAIADTGQRGLDRVNAGINTGITGLGALPNRGGLIAQVLRGVSHSKEEEGEDPLLPGA